MTDSALLLPAMGSDTAPTWDGGRWIGELDEADARLTSSATIGLAGAQGYRRARILIRSGIAPRGFADVAIRDGAVAVAELTDRIAALPPGGDVPSGYPMPPITVAVTTRDRPHRIASLIDSLLGLDYPDFDVLIVDNASTTTATVDLVNALANPRVRVTSEPKPGAARGRNRAIEVATNEIIAFVDDDVVVDRWWLQGVAIGFTRSPRAGVISGMVATGEVRSAAQQYFEDRINWEVATEHRVFSLQNPPTDIPLFPFEVGFYGTGANFAIKRSLALQLGGMNEALGTGSPSGGGEDIDLFVRAMYAGTDLIYEPTSLVWHRHREDMDSLGFQMMNYGRGMGAWIGCMLTGRETRRDALRSTAKVLARLSNVGKPVAGSETAASGSPELRRREVVGMITGPYWYVRSRLQGRKTRPLSR